MPRLVATARAQDDGERVDTVLAAWLDEPRARVHRRVVAGEVSVAGQPVVKSRRLVEGEEVIVAEPPAVTPATPPPPVPVRYEDDDLAVVAKPAGLVVHAGAGVHDATLVDALRAQGIGLSTVGDPSRPGIVHRLDRGTSGLLAVAKSDDALLGLTALLRDRAVERRYVAVVDGVPEPASATVDAPIGRSTAVRTRFAVDPAGRRAVTHYDVVEAFSRAARLDVRLETGRTHQVRVHCAAIGHPVTGDATYGAARGLATALGLERPFLHATRLAFDHPVTGVRVVVDEALPTDLVAALERLRDG